MRYTREYVESKGRTFCQPPQENGDWLLINALGIPMYVRKDDFSVTPCLVRDGFWESWITAWFLNEISPKTFFVDVGANTGYYSMIAARQGAHVIAYEPNPKYVEMLRESVKIGWTYSRDQMLPEGHFNVQPHAVSNKVGRATLTIPGSLEGSATIRDLDLSKYDPYQIECTTVTLDYHLAGIQKQEMLIKVDAESAEELVWDGAFETRYRQKPVWMIEYTPGAYGKDFLDKLESYGSLAWVNHSGEEEPITKNKIIAHGDWLMLIVRPRG